MVSRLFFFNAIVILARMNPVVPHQRQWFEIENIDEVESPALLVYPDRVKENIRRMVAIAGTPEKLRPHAKTHKLSEVASLQIGVGIKKFKARSEERRVGKERQ